MRAREETEKRYFLERERSEERKNRERKRECFRGSVCFRERRTGKEDDMRFYSKNTYPSL